ncbi:choice-of-anchor I family protein [Endozoicomonas euniceicola]|uniref:Choice-of-anchor I family protein n=1 Tax=Endozoicomonas euniceicola TaxID=1234143 RepID=A0ABY6GMF0_9GAMM|nr:choice-of-anchor I family protein [Endozoicomonas euniceicola]UYM13885.1 choice-of-anchor I family protein [Endozoicomonas euniceicola]
MKPQSFKGSLLLTTLALTTVLTGCAPKHQRETARHPDMQPVGRYASGIFHDGAAEIIGWHSGSQSVFVINSGSKTIDILDASHLNSQRLANPVTDSNLTKRGLINLQRFLLGIPLGSANSLALHDDLLAVVVEAENKQEQGVLMLFEVNQSGRVAFKDYVYVGELPDMVTITPDGHYALVANEGEPSDDYKVDPEGSVSIVEIHDNGTVGEVRRVSFADFNKGRVRHGELDKNVRVFGRNASVAQDLEPEYIAVSDDSKTAFVSLQENNALAIIDIDKAEVAKVVPLGFKDFGRFLTDLSDKDGVNLKKWSGVYGMYQPDTIASYTVNGKTFVVSANEGDARDYWYNSLSEKECLASGGLKFNKEDGCLGFSEEVRVKKIKVSPDHPNAEKAQSSTELGRLKISNTLGDVDKDGQFEKLYSYGGRSFSIWDAKGNLMFDSGDDFERITADILGADFNNNDDETRGDSRSDDKGPEPEALALGQINGRHYAFIGLERTGGIFMYDITHPKSPEYVRYVHNRDFTINAAEQPEKSGDLSPEGMVFVSAEDSPTGNPLLAVGHEVSGTTLIYELR